MTTTIEQKLENLTALVEEMREKQRKTEELIEDMVPILKLAMAAGTDHLQRLEEKGYFRLGREVVGLVDTMVTSYAPEELKPLGICGMLRASRDQDVQRGMAVFLQLLRNVGRATQPAGGGVARPRLGIAPQPDSSRAKLAAALGPKLGPSRGPHREPQTKGGARPAAVVSTKATVLNALQSISGVELTAEGFLADPGKWTREIAIEVARTLGINELTPAHWKLLDFAREEFLTTQASPNIRRISTGAGVTTKDIYTLFPKAPGKAIAKIAGTPKPVGCI